MDELSCNVNDVALCFEGGGYRAAYTAAFANLLLENNIHFGFVCGISAGASHAVDYVSRDCQRVHDSFIVLTARRPQAGGARSALMGRGYFNGDYVYRGCVADGYLPFDWQTFSASPARVRIQSYDADASRSVQWTKDDMPDVWQMMDRVRASSTLPALMKPIRMDGHLMYDGGLGQGGGIPVCLAEAEGFERFLVVLSQPRGFRKGHCTGRERRLYRHVARENENLYRALVQRNDEYDAALDHLDKLERQGRALVVYPREMPVKSTTIKTDLLVAAYNLGKLQYADTLPRVEDFLFGRG